MSDFLTQDTFFLESRLVNHSRKFEWVIYEFSKFPEETAIASKEFKLAPDCTFKWEVIIELSTEYIFIDVNRTDQINKRIRVEGFLSFQNSEGKSFHTGGKTLYVGSGECHQLYCGKRPGYPASSELEDFPLEFPDDNITLKFHFSVTSCCVKTEEVDDPHQWQSFSSPVNNFQREVPEQTDVLVKVGDRTIPCHKHILCNGSLVFRKMLMDDKTDVITLDDVNADIVTELLTYLYTDTICEVSPDVVSELYTVAAMFQVEGLQHKCGLTLVNCLNETTVLKTFRLADQHNDASLKDAASAFIKVNFDKLKDAAEFWSFVHDNRYLFIEMISSSLGPK